MKIFIEKGILLILLSVLIPVFVMANGQEEKRDFTIFNTVGMGEYYDAVVIPAFTSAYGDKYEIHYESIGWQDAIAKIQAQGLKAGKGNINIIIVGDGATAKGLEAGVWMHLDSHRDQINYNNMTDIAKDTFQAYDTSIVPILFQHQDAGIAYVPTTPAGQALETVIGSDGKLTYDELFGFLLNDSNSPKFGRGRIGKSGAGDAWTWGLLQEEDEYGVLAVPEKAISRAAEIYATTPVRLYDGTSTTFTELTEGNLDVICHSIPWFYRLHAKGKMDNLPENLREDTKGLENADFALMSGEGIKSLAAGHYFVVPSNIDPEMLEDSLTFLEFVISPEINAAAYAGIAMPAYSASTIDKIQDENIKMIWNEVRKYYPESYLNNEGNIVFKKGSYTFYETDIAKVNIYYKSWQEKVESLIK